MPRGRGGGFLAIATIHRFPPGFPHSLEGGPPSLHGLRVVGIDVVIGRPGS
jgi:hypothetical protein